MPQTILNVHFSFSIYSQELKLKMTETMNIGMDKKRMQIDSLIGKLIK